MPAISQLPNTVVLNPADLFVLVQNGVTDNIQASVVIATIQSTFGLNPLANGQLWIGSTGTTPVAANLIAGTGITIANNAGYISISAPGGTGFMLNIITTTSATMAGNNGYVTNDASLVTLTLPLTSNFGDIIKVIGKGAGGWTVAQNAGQNIVFGSSATTVGVSGSLASTQAKDSFTMTCTVANTEWTINEGVVSAGLTIV